MSVTVVDAPPADVAGAAWDLYGAAFVELAAFAVQRHLMFRTEFDGVMTDKRVRKYLSFDRAGGLRGLSTFTNDLAAMPLVSPEYFQRRWPRHFVERRVWYCGFVAVADSARGSTAFGELVEAMYRTAEEHDGVIGLDLCEHNDQTRHLSRVIGLLLHRVSRGKVRTERADIQQFWTYETAPDDQKVGMA